MVGDGESRDVFEKVTPGTLPWVAVAAGAQQTSLGQGGRVITCLITCRGIKAAFFGVTFCCIVWITEGRNGCGPSWYQGVCWWVSGRQNVFKKRDYWLVWERFLRGAHLSQLMCISWSHPMLVPAQPAPEPLHDSVSFAPCCQSQRAHTGLVGQHHGGRTSRG